MAERDLATIEPGWAVFGGGASAAGSGGPVSGPDAQTGRLGGAGRGGTSDLPPPPERQGGGDSEDQDR